MDIEKYQQLCVITNYALDSISNYKGSIFFSCFLINVLLYYNTISQYLLYESYNTIIILYAING